MFFVFSHIQASVAICASFNIQNFLKKIELHEAIITMLLLLYLRVQFFFRLMFCGKIWFGHFIIVLLHRTSHCIKWPIAMPNNCADTIHFSTFLFAVIIYLIVLFLFGFFAYWFCVHKSISFMPYFWHIELTLTKHQFRKKKKQKHEVVVLCVFSEKNTTRKKFYVKLSVLVFFYSFLF